MDLITLLLLVIGLPVTGVLDFCLFLIFWNLGDQSKHHTYIQETLVSQIILNVSYKH